MIARRVPTFVVAWLVTAVWGTVVQTQFNLAALTELGAQVPLALRLLTTAQDLAPFGVVYAGIVLAGWLPAFAVAAWLARRRPGQRVALFAVAATVGLVSALRAVDAVAPMPVFIDATRSLAGWLTMALIALPAGAWFAAHTGTRPDLHVRASSHAAT